MKKLHCLITAALLAALFFSACKKHDIIPAAPATNPTVLPSQELVSTPAGFFPKSQVHLIESGYRLATIDGRLKKVQAQTGRVVADFGEATTSTGRKAFLPVNASARGNGVIPGFGSGWITYGEWTNNTGNPISSFVTNWVVPTAPSTYSGQTVYLFNALQDNMTGTDIIQPVLQYGPSAAGGGNYWTISNWCIVGTSVFVMPPVTVNPGTNLQGVITLTGQSNGFFNYESSFTGYPAVTLQVNNTLPQQFWAAETMEAYNIAQASDYPADLLVQMTGIQLLTGANNAPVSWTAHNVVTDVGQHTIVVTNGSPNGEVDLYFHQPPPTYSVTCSNAYTRPFTITLTDPATNATVYSTGVTSGNFTSATKIPGGTYNVSVTAIVPGTYNYQIGATVRTGVQNTTVNNVPFPGIYSPFIKIY